MRLVADIGGTNARIGLCEDGIVAQSKIQRYVNENWDSLSGLLTAYLDDQNVEVDEMVIAVAGPVQGARAQLTNRNWTIDASELADAFSCKRVELLNDLGALGYAVPVLDAKQALQISGDVNQRKPTGQALVVGIGTGFNISQVITTEHGTVCPPAEAGHISMPSSIAAKLKTYGCDPSLFPTVETLFSGRGLTMLCRACLGSDDVTGEQVIKRYQPDNCNRATVAINSYAALLGTLLREFSLTYMPSQGTFFAGSVARAIVETASAPLLAVLEEPCRFRLPGSCSIFSIEDDGAALLGCARLRC